MWSHSDIMFYVVCFCSALTSDGGGLLRLIFFILVFCSSLLSCYSRKNNLIICQVSDRGLCLKFIFWDDDLGGSYMR